MDTTYFDRADGSGHGHDSNQHEARTSIPARTAAYAWWAGFFGIALISCLQQIRLLRRLTTRYFNEDHALLWGAAKDWSRLDVHEPTFYGQGYGVTFEAIPTALLHAFAVPYHVALPLALVGMAFTAWWLLSWAALRRGMRLAALLAVAAPVLVNFEHWIVVSVIGTGAGRLLAAACTALVLAWPSSRRNVALAVALGGGAAVIDNASALLAGPALVWAAWGWLHNKRVWPAALLGSLVPIAWLGFVAWFDHGHPDHLMHPSWPFTPERYTLLENWFDPDPLLAVQALELYRHGILIPIVIGAALLVALMMRAYREVAAISSLLVLLIALAALRKSLDSMSSLWFPAARMTLACPMALWFACSLALHPVLKRLRCSLRLYPHLPMLARTTTLLVLALVVASALELRLNWSKRIDPIRRAGLQESIMPLSRPADVLRICDEAKLAAERAGTWVVAFPSNRTAAYACPAIYPELVTVFPQYERRTWVLDALAWQRAKRMILWDSDGDFCNAQPFRDRFRECTPINQGRAVLLRFKHPSPPLLALRMLGHPPRPFGPGCHPTEPETCRWWAEQYAKR